VPLTSNYFVVANALSLRTDKFWVSGTRNNGTKELKTESFCSKSWIAGRGAYLDGMLREGKQMFHYKTTCCAKKNVFARITRCFYLLLKQDALKIANGSISLF